MAVCHRKLAKNKSRGKAKTRLECALLFFILIMSPKKPVENLRVLCLKIVLSFTLDYVKSSSSASEELAIYLSKLPKILKEEILSQIFSLIPLNSAIKWASFCAFRGCFRTFDFQNVSTKYHEQFANKLENLVNLNAKFAQVRRSEFLK